MAASQDSPSTAHGHEFDKVFDDKEAVLVREASATSALSTQIGQSGDASFKTMRWW